MELVTPYPILQGTNTFSRMNEGYQSQTKTYEPQRRINLGLNQGRYTPSRNLRTYGAIMNLGEREIGLGTVNYGTVVITRNMNQTPNIETYETSGRIPTENQTNLEEILKRYAGTEEKPFDLEEMLREYGMKKREETLIT